tara:strand:- start:369 stop:602 length:234 start_codon:yes stop_codon:yes gene_type:complete
MSLRQFSQLQTNLVNVLLNDRPVRASTQSVLWPLESKERLWENRSKYLADAEKEAARQAYDQTLIIYETILLQTQTR